MNLFLNQSKTFKSIVLEETQNRSPKQNDDPFVQSGTCLLPDSMDGRPWGNRTYRVWWHTWKYVQSIQSHTRLLLVIAKAFVDPHGFSENTGALLDVFPHHPGSPGDRRCCSTMLLSPSYSIGIFKDLSCSPCAPQEMSTAFLSPLEDPPTYWGLCYLYSFLCCPPWVGQWERHRIPF